MSRELLSKLAVGLTSAAFAASVFGAVVPSDRDSSGATAAKPVSTADRDIPLVNWSAPQFFNPQVGVSSNMPGLMASGISPKAALTWRRSSLSLHAGWSTLAVCSIRSIRRGQRLLPPEMKYGSIALPATWRFPSVTAA